LKQSQLEREKLNQDLNEMIKLKSTEQDSKIMSMNAENQQILFKLRNENNDLKTKVKNLSKQFDNKCEQVLQCENDMKMLKGSHEEQMRQDEESLNDLRIQLKETTRSSELRINDLEAKISQLCSTVASYENGNNINGSFSSNVKLSGSISSTTNRYDELE
jgi:hypothetical protein